MPPTTAPPAAGTGSCLLYTSKVLYGINVSAIVKSIMNKVRYAVSQAVGLQVAKINVFVDDMAAE